MASASAGRSSGKSGKRFLRTAGKTKRGRFATKAEMAANRNANSKMKQSFKRSIAATKAARNRKS